MIMGKKPVIWSKNSRDGDDVMPSFSCPDQEVSGLVQEVGLLERAAPCFFVVQGPVCVEARRTIDQ